MSNIQNEEIQGLEGLKIRFIPDIQEFESIPLLNKDGQSLTRKVVKATFINPNPKNPDAPLKISICHQRRKSDGNFEDCEHFDLKKLPSGNEVRIPLDTEQTLALNEILTKLTDYCKNNLGWGGNTPIFSLERVDEIVKIAPNRKSFIQKLVDGNYEEEFWQELKNLNPKATTKLAYARLYETRRFALEEFQNELEMLRWNEPDWQIFFENNPWILGYGLTYKWLRPVGKRFEATTKGNTFNEPGKRPDAFAQVVASVSTTVFGDIKKPQTPLLRKTEYRPSVYIPHREVIGGVMQIQKSIDDWISDGNTKYTIKNEKGFDKDVVYSHRPKGILIVGNLEQFKSDESYNDDCIASFENYRRETSNPEILTFDELYHRAKNIVSSAPEDVK